MTRRRSHARTTGERLAQAIFVAVVLALMLALLATELRKTFIVID